VGNFSPHSERGESFCLLKTFHNSYLSVAEDGTVGTSVAPGESERFECEHIKDDKYALKTSSGKYLSVQPGDGEKSQTVEAVNAVNGDCELFEIKS